MHAPIKELTAKEIKLKSKPWITHNINKLIRNRNKLFIRKKRQPNNAKIKVLYNMKRNEVNRETLKSKKNHFIKYFQENNNNIKNIESGIREIVNIKNSISPKPAQLNIEGKIIVNHKEIATNLNIFFTNIGPNSEANLPKVKNISPGKFLRNRNHLNIIIAQVSEEVLSFIKSLENKSIGPSSIHVNLLKMIPDLIILALCQIINMSFHTHIFPEKLKIVKVIPVYKNGSTQDMNNFCPISLLSIFDKIMEKLMHIRLNGFLEDNNILYKNQFGFIKDNSSLYALLQIIEKIKEGKFGCGIFIDLRKAFDTVNHEKLLQKMDHDGVRESALSIMTFQDFIDSTGHCVSSSPI